MRVSSQWRLSSCFQYLTSKFRQIVVVSRNLSTVFFRALAMCHIEKSLPDAWGGRDSRDEMWIIIRPRWYRTGCFMDGRIKFRGHLLRDYRRYFGKWHSEEIRIPPSLALCDFVEDMSAERVKFWWPDWAKAWVHSTLDMPVWPSMNVNIFTWYAYNHFRSTVHIICLKAFLTNVSVKQAFWMDFVQLNWT